MRARQGAQHPSPGIRAVQPSHAASSEQAGQRPSHPTHPTQCLLKEPYLQCQPTCPQHYPPLPLQGRFQRHISAPQLGSSGNYFLSPFSWQFMLSSGSFSHSQISSLHFQVTSQRKYWPVSVCQNQSHSLFSVPSAQISPAAAARHT